MNTEEDISSSLFPYAYIPLSRNDENQTVFLSDVEMTEKREFAVQAYSSLQLWLARRTHLCVTFC